jgi:acyl carrier protein
MTQEEILTTMHAYFAEFCEPEELHGFEGTLASDLIEDSMDAMTFVMHLEEKTGRHIPMSQAAGLTGLTFEELARQLCAGEIGVAAAAS